MPQAIIKLPVDALKAILNGSFIGVMSRDAKLISADEIVIKRYWLDSQGDLYANIEHEGLWNVCAGCDIPQTNLVMRYE